MPVRYILSHPLVEENINQAAIERGPLVYCIESSDVHLDTLNDLLLDPEAAFSETTLEIKGRTITVLESEAYAICRDENYLPDALYQPLRYNGLKKTPVRFIPYFAWDNREFGEMKIWLPFKYE